MGLLLVGLPFRVPMFTIVPPPICTAASLAASSALVCARLTSTHIAPIA